MKLNTEALAKRRAELRAPREPTVVRHSFFFVPDLTPDPLPSFVPLFGGGSSSITSSRLAVGSQDCAFSPATLTTFTHVVNVGYDIPNAFPAQLAYKKLNMPDLAEFDARTAVFDEAHRFIDRALASSPEAKVLVHCQAGVSRSVLIVVSYMQLVRARRGLCPSFLECMADVKLVRPQAQPNAGFVLLLQRWEAELTQRFDYHSSHHQPMAAAAAAQPLPPLRVRLWRWLGKLRFGWLLVRPLVTLLAVLVLCIRLLPRLRSWSTTLSSPDKWLAAFSAWNVGVLLEDAVFQANWWGRLDRARPGVYFPPQLDEVMRPLLPLTDYQAPAALRLLGGDVATCAFALLNQCSEDQVFTRRQRVEEDGGGVSFALDWTYPPHHSHNGGGGGTACLLMAGIGGGSSSAYVKDVARHLAQQGGFAVCVLLCNDGASAHTCQKVKLDGMFNPGSDREARRAIDLVCGLYSRVLLVGFSLGGVAVCRLLSSQEALPRNLVGGVSVSGSFSVDFISLPRYRDYYQAVLVPGLVDNITRCFSAELHARGALAGVLQCETYEQLHRELYVGAGLLSSAVEQQDFAEWKRRLGGNALEVQRPLLLVSDLADPLHHGDHLGLDALWETDGAPPNLAVVITNGGGHVAWPQADFRREGYAYMRKLVLGFCEGVLKQQQQQQEEEMED